MSQLAVLGFLCSLLKNISQNVATTYSVELTIDQCNSEGKCNDSN